VDDLMVAHI